MGLPVASSFDAGIGYGLPDPLQQWGVADLGLLRWTVAQLPSLWFADHFWIPDRKTTDGGECSGGFAGSAFCLFPPEQFYRLGKWRRLSAPSDRCRSVAVLCRRCSVLSNEFAGHAGFCCR